MPPSFSTGKLTVMRLLAVRLSGVGPLTSLTLRLGGDEGPRPLTVLFGADGVGKTSLLSAIAATRPGYALPLIPRARVHLDDADDDEGAPPCFAVSEWALGDDDPERPHPLRVASPNAQLGENDAETALRRREQALFDRRAQEAGGHVLVSFSGARWFSRTTVMLASPDRTILRYDVRAAPSFDDATRSDLAREAKQVLSYAALASAVEAQRRSPGAATELDTALRETCAVLTRPLGVEWRGVHLPSLEPIFAFDGRVVGFDDLPRSARHLIAIGALTVRALAGAYPDSVRPIREREGVVLIDDLESQQDGAVLRELPPLLRASLPRAQWIVSTAASAVTQGCEHDEVVAMRRDEGRVVLHEGAFALLH